jgi:hypothetical protein
MMKFNPITIVLILAAIGGIAYYLHNHYITVNVDIKDQAGSKSHMNVKHEASKEKHEDHA